jgi:acyl carrier protein
LQPEPLEQVVTTQVIAAITALDRRFARQEMTMETSLVDDLSMDSFRFVELAFAIESAVGLTEFPVQEWVDAESARTSKRFTVASLVMVCVDCLRREVTPVSARP